MADKKENSTEVASSKVLSTAEPEPTSMLILSQSELETKTN